MLFLFFEPGFITENETAITAVVVKGAVVG
jgi:hypothetical protein